MRIVSLEEFRKLPNGTIFSKYEPCYFSGMEIKYDNCGERDFISVGLSQPFLRGQNRDGDDIAIIELSQEAGSSFDLDFEIAGRDGCFEDEQLFAIWETNDLIALRKKIDAAITLAP